MNNRYEGLLISIPGIGRTKYTRLLGYFGSAREAWNADVVQFQRGGELSLRETAQFEEYRKNVSPDTIWTEWQRKGIRVITQEDQDYPCLLKRIYDPPVVLFVVGSLPANMIGVAVVGSRHCTAYGKNVARAASRDIAQSGVVIVSGGARGIDTHAHMGAMEHGKTAAVLGCGVDIAYPPENAKLFKDIARNGCILSEYVPGTPPLAGQFPARNRIIAGLCHSLIVVEAAEKSGALITADFAMNENRDVYAVPGSIFSSASRGTNRLIQQGARLFTDPNDVLEDLGILPVEVNGRPAPELTSAAESVLQCIPFDGAVTAEDIVQQTAGNASLVQVSLLQLEMSGSIQLDAGHRYTRITKEWKNG